MGARCQTLPFSGRRTRYSGLMKDLSPDALLWWWSLPEKQQLDIEVSCLEEAVSLSDIIYLLSGQVFADLQPRD